MRKISLIVIVVVLLLLGLAQSAFAGQVTKIAYTGENFDVYTYTPELAGIVQVTLTWWRPGDPASRPVFPESECNAVVQTDDGSEYYMDIDKALLYSGSNPEIDSWSVPADIPIYISVMGYLGTCPYELKIEWKATAKDPWTVAATYTGTAYGANGEVFVPETGTWLSVLQQWPGTLPDDISANWDDYVEAKPPARANNLAYNYSIEYVSGVRTETAITNPLAGFEYVVAPQIWTSAENPAVWTNYGTDIYPKPGSIAWNGSLVWYTYSWPDSTKATAPAYFMGTVNNLTSSARSFSMEGNTKASVTTEFYGPTVTWVYTKAPKGGVAKVLIDGAVPPSGPPTVDQKNVGGLLTSQSTTWSGLTNAKHTITVMSNGTSTSGYLYLYHDAFLAPGVDGDATLNAENNIDGYTTYAWGKVTPSPGASNPSGGSYSMEGSAGAATAFTFSGTSVTWLYTKAPKGGVARVYIDGVDKGTVNLYAASLTYQAEATFGNLGAGWHQILIKNNGTSSSGFLYLYSDAFRVGTTTYEN